MRLAFSLIFVLALSLGFVFYTSSIKTGFWKKFYSIIPAVLMCYLLPALLSSFGVVNEEWHSVNELGEATKLG
jgi:hypothetical protein